MSKSTKARRPTVLAAVDLPEQLTSQADCPPASEAARKHTSDWFGAFASNASSWLGSKWAFAAAILIILVWAATGPIFHFSDTWQLVINTGTTIVTFLMVFLIQNTQNRDARAINLKLDELIRAIDAAGDHMIDIENRSDVELAAIQAKYTKMRTDLPEESPEEK
jgi:low affinity Fe/Cu permease